MRKLLLCFMVMFASNVSWSADFQRGLTAAQNGDFATAAREWIPLAEQGSVAAQFNLGQLYYSGRGVLQDKVYSHMWHNIASSYATLRLKSRRQQIIECSIKEWLVFFPLNRTTLVDFLPNLNVGRCCYTSHIVLRR